MNEKFAEMLTTAETEGIESIEEVLREAKFVDANRERVGEGRQGDVRRACEIHKFRGFDDREERIGDGREHGRGYMRTIAEERWEECSECNARCMYPKPVKDVGQVRLAIMQWEEKWKVMMSELGEGAEDPRSMENVGVVGDLSKEREGTDVVEVG